MILILKKNLESKFNIFFTKRNVIFITVLLLIYQNY